MTAVTFKCSAPALRHVTDIVPYISAGSRANHDDDHASAYILSFRSKALSPGPFRVLCSHRKGAEIKGPLVTAARPGPRPSRAGRESCDEIDLSKGY